MLERAPLKPVESPENRWPQGAEILVSKLGPSGRSTVHDVLAKPEPCGPVQNRGRFQAGAHQRAESLQRPADTVGILIADQRVFFQAGHIVRRRRQAGTSLRILFAAHPELLTPVLRNIQVNTTVGRVTAQSARLTRPAIGGVALYVLE